MLTIRRRGHFYHCRGTVRIGKKTTIVKEHTTGCRERHAAEAYRAKLEHDLGQELLYGTKAVAASLTFSDAEYIYLNRPGGLHRNDIWRLKELNEVIGDYPIARLVEGWREFKAGRCRGLAPATVERFRATLQAAVNYAAADLQFDVPKLQKTRFNNQRVRFLAIAERDSLLVHRLSQSRHRGNLIPNTKQRVAPAHGESFVWICALGVYPSHVQLVMIVLCFQGCRTQEALRLQWQEVNLPAGRIYFADTKTGDPRSVAMHPKVRDALTGLWEVRGRPTRDTVFLNRLGRPYADTRTYKYPGGNPLRKAHETACRKAEIRDFRVHDWRHHWASWCVMSGVDLLTIMRMGGWKTLRMVERYAAVSVDHMDAAVAKVK